MSGLPFEVIAVDYGGTLATGPHNGRADRPIDPDAVQALHRLHRADIRLVLSSNTPGASRRPALEAAGVDELFCAFVESHNLGAFKPERAFYEAVIAAADCPPEQILHVGNRLDADVLVPRAVGMGAVYVCPYADPGVRVSNGVLHIRRFADLPDVLGRCV